MIYSKYRRLAMDMSTLAVNYYIDSMVNDSLASLQLKDNHIEIGFIENESNHKGCVIINLPFPSNSPMVRLSPDVGQDVLSFNTPSDYRVAEYILKVNRSTHAFQVSAYGDSSLGIYNQGIIAESNPDELGSNFETYVLQHDISSLSADVTNLFICFTDKCVGCTGNQSSIRIRTEVGPSPIALSLNDNYTTADYCIGSDNTDINVQLVIDEIDEIKTKMDSLTSVYANQFISR